MADFHELLLAGAAGACAGIFTNPIEVVKTRIQLQGELSAKGQYTRHYQNVFQAFYIIAKNDGIKALQKGLLPASYYQFIMNGIRLGVFQSFDNHGFTRDKNGANIIYKTILAASFSGCLSAFIASPFYMIKVQLQSKSNSIIAVGYQHPHLSFKDAFIQIFKTQGFIGLWQGSGASVLRVTLGSSVQLPTFTFIQNLLAKYKFFENESLPNTITSAAIGGIVLSFAIAPIDVISIRLYNQPIDPKTKKGLHYDNLLDCFIKILKTEGIHGLYKGAVASGLRFGPHTLLSLLFWREFRKYYYNCESKLKMKKDSSN